MVLIIQHLQWQIVYLQALARETLVGWIKPEGFLHVRDYVGRSDSTGERES